MDSEEQLHRLLVITAWCMQTTFMHAGAPWQLLERISAHSRAVEQTRGFWRVPELAFCLWTSFKLSFSSCFKRESFERQMETFWKQKSPKTPHAFSECLDSLFFQTSLLKQGILRALYPAVSLDYSSSYRGVVMFDISNWLNIPDERCCKNAPSLHGKNAVCQDCNFLPYLFILFPCPWLPI